MNNEEARYHQKNWVDWIFGAWWDKILQPQKWTFWGKEPKRLKKLTILHLMTTFYNVALKIETSVKLQSCLSPLWKLEKSMINVKT